MSAPALCRCGEAGGTAQCPVHGQDNPYPPTGSAVLTHQGVPSVRCALCGQKLTARWDTGRTVDDVTLAVSPHRCPSVTTRVIDADALTDEELLDAVKARGLVVR